LGISVALGAAALLAALTFISNLKHFIRPL
jgi:hypothetical protein